MKRCKTFLSSRYLRLLPLALGAILLSPVSLSKAAKPKPTFQDFMGLNVHTVLFKPERYRPIARLVRDYHGFKWDVGDESNYAPRFPFARNGVNWEDLYGTWKRLGYRVHVSLMFDDTPPSQWKDLPADASAYGEAFARFFGPSGSRRLVESVEIGNEPGNYPDEEYRTLFRHAAQGLRRGDPRLRIVTCAADAAPSGKYHKSLDLFKDMTGLFDAINVHAYAEVEGYPTWRRSYPEDPKIDYLKRLKRILRWRDRHASGKEVWVTEFGWDSTTQPQAKEGTFKQWVGVTDTQQAQYLVRSFLAFSALDIDRSYLFWFDDRDQASVHGSSGLTRKGRPKPSFHAVAHLRSTLGDYRFRRIVGEKPGHLHVYEYQHATRPRRRIWAVWSPTGRNRTLAHAFSTLPGRLVKAERMPLASGQPAPAALKRSANGATELTVDESPLYLWLEDAR